MPTALAQTITAKYKLDAERADRVLRTDATDDRIELAKLIGEELQSPGLYGAPIRMRRFNVNGKTVTGEFVGTEDGRSYSFTYTNGQVSYQPSVGTLDSSESVKEFTARWDSHTAALEATVSNPVRLDATGKKLKCGTATYQCGGICQGVHRSCHKNEKAAINHDRLKKINALIEHLNQGGEHPSKALDKPDAAKLQSVAEGIQKTRDLRAQNLQAKRTGDRMAKAKEAAKALRNQVDDEYWKFHYGARTNPDRMMELAAKANRAEIESGAARIWNRPYSQQSETIFGYKGQSVHKKQVERALDRGENVPETVLKDYPDLAAKYGKPKPATMTVGAIAPSTKAPQLIPQSKTITPEVLPPEKPQGGAKKRIAGLLDKLQENHEAGTKNAAQISAVAHTALHQLDPTHTPKLATAAATTYEAPKGSGRQRVAKLMGDLQVNHEADVKNAAATYAVAQSAVNQLKAQEAGQKATPKQLSGQTGKEGGGGAIEKKGQQPFTSIAAKEGVEAKKVNGVDLGTLTPSELKKLGNDGADEIHRRMAFEGHNMTFDQYKDHEHNRARARYNAVLTANVSRENRTAHQSDVEAIEGVIRGHTSSKGDARLKIAHQQRVENAIASGELTVAKAKKLGHFKTYPELAAKYAPPAPTTKARTAGEVTPQYQRNRHISVDSITSAIARLQQRGTRIDSATALELLRKCEKPMIAVVMNANIKTR